MGNSLRRSRAPRGTPSGVVVAVALLACVGLAACTEVNPSNPFPTADADRVAAFPQSGELDAGRYVVTTYTVPFEITIPNGWSTLDGANLYKYDPDDPGDWAVFLTFWPATHVPTDACAWQGALVPVDPTAEAFVEAVTAQRSAVSSPPVEVVVGDYSGFEFDHSVEADVNVLTCDGGSFCIYAESGNGCSRWYSTEDERETYRVVDLNGERAVIAVGQFHRDIDPALTKEARAVFDSIKFVGRDE